MTELQKAPLVLTELKDRVYILRMNRADKKNALTQGMYTALADGLDEAAADSQVRVLLITGVLEAFCAGSDLADFLNTPPATQGSPVERFMTTLAKFPKPVIGAVTGPAVGIGVTMLLHCDLVYAGSGAKLQMPFVNIGICPEFASSLLMPKIMGHARAAELTMFGEPFTAEVAKEYGLVNAVLPDAEVETYALQRALKLAAQPPNALRVTKMLLKRWDEKQALDAIQFEATYFIPMLKMPEAKEAMSAFMGKRKPDFSRFE